MLVADGADGDCAAENWVSRQLVLDRGVVSGSE